MCYLHTSGTYLVPTYNIKGLPQKTEEQHKINLAELPNLLRHTLPSCEEIDP